MCEMGRKRAGPDESSTELRRQAPCPNFGNFLPLTFPVFCPSSSFDQFTLPNSEKMMEDSSDSSPIPAAFQPMFVSLQKLSLHAVAR